MTNVQELKQLNAKIDALKDQNATAIAELRVLQQQLDAKIKTLNEQTGLNVTLDNVEELYNNIQAQLTDKAQKVQSLLADLTGSAPTVQAPQMAAQPLQYGTQPTMDFNTQSMMPFGTSPQNAPVQQPASQPINYGVQLQSTAVPTGLPSEKPVDASFANFDTGTIFNI